MFWNKIFCQVQEILATVFSSFVYRYSIFYWNSGSATKKFVRSSFNDCYITKAFVTKSNVIMSESLNKPNKAGVVPFQTCRINGLFAICNRGRCKGSQLWWGSKISLSAGDPQIEEQDPYGGFPSGSAPNSTIGFLPRFASFPCL